MSTSTLERPPQQEGMAALNAVMARYKTPSVARSLGQIADTFIPLFSLFGLMHWLAAKGHVWPVLLLAVPAGGLLMRVFIIQHDCGHGSFFASTKANDRLGALLGVMTLTPYSYWKQTHAIHHATSGNLDKRGWGDISTLTVAEYRSLSSAGKLWYRIYRSVPVLFILGPAFHFLIFHRLPSAVPPDWRKERMSILWTDVGLALVLAVASRTVGLGQFLLVHLPAVVVAAWSGVWFFYVQHQYEQTYWRRDGEWDFARASLEGSSFYDLPRVLQWLTGNISFHHIHHLNSRIPNYRLEACMRENPVFQNVTRLTLLESFKCAKLALWDEASNRLVGFDAVR